MRLNEFTEQNVEEGMMGNSDSPVAQAIIRRILIQRTDLLAKYGPSYVGQAVDDVADSVGDWDEIGSSDVSGWVRQVEHNLKNKLNQYDEPMNVGDALDEQAVAEGEKSPIFKDSQKADRIRSLKNLIAIAQEQGRQLRVQELELELKKLQGVTEMDKSSPQPGRDGRVSHSTYGSRDKGGSKGTERAAQPITAKKAAQHALDILKKQGVAEGSGGVSVRQWANQVRRDHGTDVKFRNRQEGGGAVDSVIARNSQGETVGVYNRKSGFPTVYEPKQGVAEGELATYLVSVMDSATGEHWRIEVKVTSPEMAKERAEAMGYKVLDVKEKPSMAEGAGNIGSAIKSLYRKIYRAGDDEIEYFYNASPIFAQYWDEYEGDLDSIIAEVDPSELAVIKAELESYVQDANLAEAGFGRATGRAAWDSNMPGYQGDYGGAENWGRREREDDEHHEIDRRMEQEREYRNTHGTWYVRIDGLVEPTPYTGKAAANAAALELKKQPGNENKIFMLTTKA